MHISPFKKRKIMNSLLLWTSEFDWLLNTAPANDVITSRRTSLRVPSFSSFFFSLSFFFLVFFFFFFFTFFLCFPRCRLFFFFFILLFRSPSSLYLAYRVHRFTSLDRHVFLDLISVPPCFLAWLRFFYFLVSVGTVISVLLQRRGAFVPRSLLV